MSSVPGEKLVQETKERWDRSLVIISLPHAAAFGAGFGKYNFSPKNDIEFWHMMAILLTIPLASIWLFFIHDLLRNTFLRVGHAGRWLKWKHTFLFLVVPMAPVTLLFLGWEHQAAENRQAAVLIAFSLVSWSFMATFRANDLYLNTVRALGVASDD